LIVPLGAVFAVMNHSFYLAIDRPPLSTVAAIEFVGPILLAPPLPRQAGAALGVRVSPPTGRGPVRGRALFT
jgi:inner membrane transporter RhtA